MQCTPRSAYALSKITHRLLGSAGLYLAATLLMKGLSLALVPIYTRLLNPAEYGTVALAEATAGVVAVLGSLGIPVAYSRLAFTETGHRGELGPNSLTVLALGLAAALAGAVLLWPVLIESRLSIAFFPFVITALGTGALAQVADLLLRHLQAVSRHGRYVALTLVGFGVATAASLSLVVVGELGALGLLGGRLCGGLAMAILLVPIARAHFLGKRPSGAGARELLRFALPLVPYQLSLLLIQVSDQFVVDAVLGASQVGLYSVGYALGMVMQVFNAALYSAWHPAFYRLAAQNARGAIGGITQRFVLLLCIVASVGILVSRDFVPLVFDERFHGAWVVVPFVVLGCLFHGYFSLFQLSLLQAKHSGTVAVVTVVTLVANVVLNLWWVPVAGILGAAVATAASYCLEAVVAMVVAQRVFRVHVSWWRLAGPLGLVAVAMGGTFVPIEHAVTGSVLRGLLVLLLLGGGVRVGVLLGRSLRDSPDGSQGSDGVQHG